MNESAVKRRIWIRNAIIIVLAVLLLLTFFSNTILNRSLPEVSVQYPQWNTISTRVHVSGTVQANQTYDVTIDQTREIDAVHVRVGQTVSAGDVLMTLTDGGSAELEAARRELDDLNIQLIQKLKADPSKGTSSAEETLRELKTQLSDAEAKLVSLQEAYDAFVENEGKLPTLIELESAKNSAVYEAALVESLGEEIDRLMGKRGQLGGSGYFTDAELTDLYEKAKATAAAAEAQAASATASYVGVENNVKTLEQAREEAQANLDSINAFIDNYTATFPNAELPQNYTMIKTMTENQIAQLGKDIAAAEKMLATAKEDLAEAQELLAGAKADLTRMENYKTYEELTDQIKEMTKQKEDAEARLAAAEAVILAGSSDSRDEIEKMKEEKAIVIRDQERTITSLKNQVAAAQTAVVDAQQQADLDKQQYDIELSRIRDAIAKQEATVTRLEKTQTDGKIVTPVSGVIAALPYSAGKEVPANTPVATITLVDAGYTMEVTVSAKQAASIRVGDMAEVQWYYYGETPTARVVSVVSTPGSMNQTKTVTLEITGQVEGGNTLSLSLGGQNESYENVIPNAAVREDKDGKFVLIVTSKSTPLGNRYKAKRVAVEVIASDETNSAVSGDISGQYVITHAAVPIRSGDAVRLSEDN